MATGTVQKNMVLLWENPNPTSTFAAQTVLTADQIAEYDWFAIEIKNYTAETFVKMNLVERNMPTIYVDTYGAATYGSGAANLSFRKVTIDSSGLSFGKGYSKILNATSAAAESNNTGIPTRIYGIKA